MRDEADRVPERLRDLGCVLVRADLVGRQILEHEAGVRALLQLAPRAGNARLRVDHDALRLDRVAQRLERKDRSSRVAARIRDQPSGRREELRQRIAPVAEPLRLGVLEPVPLRVERRIGETVGT